MSKSSFASFILGLGIVILATDSLRGVGIYFCIWPVNELILWAIRESVVNGKEPPEND